MYRARMGGIDGLEQLVRELGENPNVLMAQLGLTPAHFRDPDQYIDYPRMAELLHVCSTACNEPRFGLLLGQRQRTEVLGFLPLLATRATSVGDALSAADRYLYLHASGARVTPVIRGEVARLMLKISIGQPKGMAQLLQMSVAQLALFTATLLDTDPFDLPLYLRQKAPATTAPECAIRFRRLRFGQGFDGVSLAGGSLARPCHRDEEAVNRHMEDYFSSLQARYPNRLEEQVADIIGRMLPTGECSLELVAATLDLRPRTLQAQLASRASGYSEILRETRYNLATQRLSEGNVSITELALHLGYADVAVFSRHFKSWTGYSPRAWRAAGQGS